MASSERNPSLLLREIEKTPEGKFKDLVLQIFCVFVEMGIERFSAKREYGLQKAFHCIADAASKLTGAHFYPDFVSGRYVAVRQAIFDAMCYGWCEWALPSGSLIINIAPLDRAKILEGKGVRKRAEVLAWAWLDGLDDPRLIEPIKSRTLTSKVMR